MIVALVAVVLGAGSLAQAAASGHIQGPIYLNTSYTFGERAADLVARLTPTQRASQLVSSQAPAISSAANPLLTPVFAGQTTLNDAVSVGDTSFSPASTAGMTVGATVTFDPDGIAESVVLTSVGTGPSFFSPRLVVDAQPGDTFVCAQFSFGFTVGHQIRIDSGANQEIRVIQAVGASPNPCSTGTAILLTTPLALAHSASTATLQDLGAPTTFTPALTHAYPAGTVVNIAQGIPAYGWWNEALHGINAESLNASGNAVTLTNTTSYPIDLSRGASWDPDLTYQVAKAESDEAREVMRSNKFDLDFYSPTINLGRDPRWGRNDESYGEDPLLEAEVASQFVNGMEGKNEKGQLLPQGDGFYKATTTLKHYTMNNTEGYSNSDPNGRLNGSSNADERAIREYYTMPFRKIVQASQQGAVMSSYNEVNGTPSAADAYLNTTLMRETFGLQGYFTGDCDAVNQINPRHHWQPSELNHIATVVEQFAYTLGSGEDAECNAGYSTNASDNYLGPTSANTSYGGLMNAIGMHLPTANGVTNVDDLDVSATRLFTNRMKLGEFNPDSTVPWLTEAQARDKSYGVYPWVSSNANNAETETPDRLALARESGDASLVLLKNATINRKDGSTGKLLPLQVPQSGPFKVLVLGFYSNNSNFYLGGYSSIQSTAGQANEVTPYNGIKSAIQAIDPDATVDYMKGFTGTGTNAGNCCTTIDSAAVTAAASYDYVIVYAGMDSTASSGTTGTEDRDRTSLALPGQQGQLIAQVAAANPNTIGVMETIGPQDVTSFEPSTAAILWSSYNGMRKGDALADVLLGKYNPSGRTPETWYQTVGQIPSIYSYALGPVGPNGRTYMYYNGPVSYAFGYGLSYTTFGFSNLHVSSSRPSADDTIKVSVDVTNTGSLDGNEIVQMYVSTPNADPSLERPIKRLEGFQKVFLAAGQTKKVTLPIKIADLAFWNDTDQRFEVDQGVYGIQISTSSADSDIQQQATINVHGALTQEPSVLTARPRIANTDVPRNITERVMFPEGVQIDPGLTVAMNDDTLYGWVAPGQSKPFPHGMRFSYSSDRPNVVAIDHGDQIRTVSNGAATVTATVTYQGKKTSTSFVVRVLSDLTDLRINGETVTGFNPDVLDYDVILPPGVTAVPQVTASAKTGTVNVTQASGVPGVATVTSTGPDGIVATYTVNFAQPASSDEFNGTSLDPKWTVVRPDLANLAIGGGSLTITPQAGDLTTTSNNAKNLVLQPALGDWTMTSKLTFAAVPNAATQQGGIIAYQDDDNYLKFDLEATSATNIQLKTSLEDSLQSNPAVSASPIQVNQTLNTTPMNGVLPADNTIWLRMAKQGYTYTTSYSLDGDTWVPVWSTGATLSNVKVGLIAFSGAAATGPQVAFDYFHLSVPADQQIQSLSDYVGFLDLGKGLTNDLQHELNDALKRVDKGQDACHQLDDFVVKVLDAAGKNNPALTVEQAQALLYAYEIEIDLGCLAADSPVPQAEHDLLDLEQAIDSLGLKKGVTDDLGNAVANASEHLAQGNLSVSCHDLSVVTTKINDYAEHGKLTTAQAAQLTADVAAISSSLGCLT
jgi:beta-glucosidase